MPNADHQPSANPLPDLQTTPLEDLKAFIVASGHPAYRAQQVYGWLHGRHVSSYDHMTNVPRALRETLAKAYRLQTPKVMERQPSTDGSVRYVVGFGDTIAETVAIPSGDRLTVCFSTQVGCSMGCAFCATGRNGFTRNLSAAEMIDQLNIVYEDFTQRTMAGSSHGHLITNAVAMGQGEPFLNYDALLQALRLMNSPDDFAIGARKLTVSTCGIIQGVERFSREPEQFGLAVSLHSAQQSVRDSLMPAMQSQPLSQLKAALVEYNASTHRRVTLEYALIKSINDDDEALNALIDFCEGGLFHVNLLPLHPVEGSDLSPSASSVIDHWEKTLNDRGIPASIRTSRGEDINGACGQLASKVQQGDH